MQCPFCHEEVGSDEDLQLHCLVSCNAAFADPATNRHPRVESDVAVRFRWVKERPCIEREVHLISSLAGSVTLHWKESKSLYESETTEVPVGQHTCQLVIGGDVHPTEEFEVNDGSDVIFIIVKEAFLELGHASDSGTPNSSGDPGSNNEPLLIDTHERPWTELDAGFTATQNGDSNEMSPLYRELLQHQLSHGEPSWIPGSGVQSPVISEVEGDEPPVLTIRPPYVDELRSLSPVPLRPRLDLERRPGESDGVLFVADERTFDELGGERVEAPTSTPGPPLSSSPVPSSHSDRDDTIASLSGSSPIDSVLSELGVRNGSARSPLLDESLHPTTRDANALIEENTTIVQPTADVDHPGEEEHHLTTTQLSRGDAVEPSLIGMQSPPTVGVHIPEESSSRASPLGSVLGTISLPVRDSDLVISDLHASPELAASSPERTSPAGSVQSSSLFSSGLPSPLASPRGRSQSDTVAQPAQRGSPSGSTHSKTQPPLRPQSLGGSFNITDPNLTSSAPVKASHTGSPVESHRGSISGAEQSPTATHPRLSPAGSIQSTSVPPAGVSGTTEASHLQHHNSSSDSTSRSTPAQSSYNFSRRISAASSPPALLPTNSRSSRHDNQSSMPSSVHSVQDRPSGAGSPSELLMQTLHKQSAPRAFSYSGSNRISTREDTFYRQSAPPALSYNGSKRDFAREGTFQGQNPSPIPSYSGSNRTSGREETLNRQNTPPAFFRRGTNSVSGRESLASSARSLSERSPPRAGSPLWTQASGIPSHKSAFVTVSGERGTFSSGPSEEFEALKRERDTLAMELKQRTGHYQAELRRVKSRNEDLEQQILSIETVATLTKQDDDKARELEQKLLELNRTLGERDEEISRLHKSVRSLERANQLLKEDQESLKTAHALRLEDMNKINSDLQQELSDIRRRSSEATRIQRDRDEVKIAELKVLQNTLERLEFENVHLRKQLDQSSRKLETAKTEKDISDFRLSKAKSETDLTKKTKRFTSYDKHRYRDIEPTKTVSFAATTEPSRFITNPYTSPDTNYNRTYVTASQVPIIMNGHGAVRPEIGKTRHSLSSSYQDKVSRGTHVIKFSDQRRRVGSLGDDSDVSDDVEHGSYYGSYRRLTYNSESPASPVSSWEHDYLGEARNPSAVHAPMLRNEGREGRTVPRRRRPYSYDGVLRSFGDLYNRDNYPTSSDRGKSLPLHYVQGAVDFDSRPSSSYSSADSRLLTTVPYQTSVAAHSRDKLFSTPFAPSSSRDIQIGMELLVTRKRGKIGRGVVKYVGSLPGREGTFIGLELQPGEEGKHDGSLNGRRFFRCEPNRGIFVSFDKVVMCYG